MAEYLTLGSWDSNGVPKYLDSVQSIDPSLMDRIIKTLPERSNAVKASGELITDTSTRNLIIKTSDPSFTGADVYMTFLYEGAGYRNVVGYYTYPLNDDNTVPTKWDSATSKWVPMTYSDRNSVDSKGKSILKKTIVFPNASLPTWANSNGKNSMAGGGNLAPGSRVKLLYDVTDPSKKFPNNTGVGFFLIPNGWNGSTFYNAAERIHTDVTFNLNNSVQAILLNDAENTTPELGYSIISFEDIMRPGGDSDFNDIIIRIEYSPSYAVLNSTDVILPSGNPITKDNIVIDRSGMYLALTDSTFNTIKNSSSNKIIMKHCITMDDDERRGLLRDNLFQFEFENNTVVTEEDKKLIMTMTNNRTECQKYMYIISSIQNINKTSSYNKGVSALVEFQNLYVNNKTDVGQQTLTITNDTNTSTFVSNTALAPAVSNFNTAYAMGDPHIMTIYGQRYDLPNKVCTYNMYDDGELSIIGKVNTYHLNMKYPFYRGLTFIKFLQIRHGDNVLVTNLYHPDSYYNVIDDKLQKISEHSFFELNAVYPKYNERAAFFRRQTKTSNFILRYIKFNTAQLGEVYLELFLIPHRMDYVNSFSIISPNVTYLPNPKGVMVKPDNKCIVGDIDYLNV